MTTYGEVYANWKVGYSSIEPRLLLSDVNIQTLPASSLSSTSERSSIYDSRHSSTTPLPDNRIRVKQSFHKGHCKQCFESGFRASSKKPIRTHLKKYHAKEFKVAPVMQDSPDRYRCCETEFDIDTWADHVVARHCHFTNIAASSPLSPSQPSSSFQYASTSATSSRSNGRGSPYQVNFGSGTIGHTNFSNAGSRRHASSHYEELLKSSNTSRSIGSIPILVSQPHFPRVPPSLPQMLTPNTPSISAHDKHLPLAEDSAGNFLFDGYDNRIVRTFDWQQAFAIDGKCNLVCNGSGVPIPISPGQMLYAYTASGNRLTYRYGIDVL